MGKMNDIEECNKLAYAVGKLATSFDYEAQEYLYKLTHDENAVDIALSFLLSNRYILNYSSSYSNEFLQYIAEVRGTGNYIWDAIQLDEYTSKHLGHITSILFKEHKNTVLRFDDSKHVAVIDSLVAVWQLQSAIILLTHSGFGDDATDDHITRVISMVIFKKPHLLSHFTTIVNTPELTDKYLSQLAAKFKLENTDKDIGVTRYRHMIIYVLGRVLEHYVAYNLSSKISSLPIDFSKLVILSGNCSNRYLYACALLIVNSLNFHVSDDLLRQLLVIVEKSGFDCDILEMWNLAIGHLQYMKADTFIEESFKLVQVGLRESSNPINIVSILNNITVYYVNSSIPSDVVMAYKQLLGVESLYIPIEIGELFSTLRNASIEHLIKEGQIETFMSQFDIKMMCNRLIELCNPNLQCWSWLNINCYVEEVPTDYDTYIESMKNVFDDLFVILPDKLFDTILGELLESINEDTETALVAFICYDYLEEKHVLSILDKIKDLFTEKLSSNYDFVITCLFSQPLFVPHLKTIKDLLFKRFVTNMKVSNIWSRRLAKCIAILNDKETIVNVIECIQFILETSKSKSLSLLNHYPAIASLANLLTAFPQLASVNLAPSDNLLCKCLLALSISTGNLPQVLATVSVNLDILYEEDMDTDYFCLFTNDNQLAVNLLMQVYIKYKIPDVPPELHEIRHPGLFVLCNLNENLEQLRMNKVLEIISGVNEESCPHCAWACIAYSSFVVENKFNFEFTIEVVKLIYKRLPCLIKMVKNNNEPMSWELDPILDFKVNEIHPHVKCLRGTIWDIYYDERGSVGADACKYLSLVNKYSPRIIKSLSNPNVLQLVNEIEKCTGSIEAIANKIAFSF